MNDLCTGTRTFQDAVDRFGRPQSDRSEGLTTIAKNEEGAEEHTPRRVMSYDGLSDTALVRFTQRLGDLVSVSFIGKYIGPPRHPSS